jgi:hypothetical protein
VTRNYACAFTLSSVLLKEYQKLLAAVQKSQPFTAPFADIESVTKDNFEIYVKRIGPFSTFLHSFQAGAAPKTGQKHEFEFRGLFVRHPPVSLNLRRVAAIGSSVTNKALSWASHAALRWPCSWISQCISCD